jgi:hypothetical protein
VQHAPSLPDPCSLRPFEFHSDYRKINTHTGLYIV